MEEFESHKEYLIRLEKFFQEYRSNQEKKKDQVKYKKK